MNDNCSIEKAKVSKLEKDPPTFFKETGTEKKKKTNISRIEIGVRDPLEEQRKVLARPSPCGVLIFCTTLFLLILLIFAMGQLGFHDISAFQWKPQPLEPLRGRLLLPCQTRECVRYSAALLETMNPSSDPCNNFHHHVCNGFSQIAIDFQLLTKVIDRRSAAHPKVLKIVRQMLSKCALTTENTLQQHEGLSSIIPRDIPFPLLNVSWKDSESTTDIHSISNSTIRLYRHPFLTKLLAHITLHTPGDADIIGVKPSSDSEFSMFVVKPNSPLLAAHQIRNVLDILKRNTLETNKIEHSKSDWQRQINDVIRLQNEIENIEFHTNPEIVTLTTLEQSLPIIDWKTLIDSWMPNGYKVLQEKVYGFNTTYYQRINYLLASTPSETVYNLLLLRFSFKFLRSELSSQLEQECLLQVSRTVPGKIVLFGLAEPNADVLLNQMLQTIVDHLKKSLITLKWMDSRGIEEAQKKLNKTKAILGFHGAELIEELSIFSNQSYISALCSVFKWQTRNMFKSIAENDISVFLNSEVFYSVEKNEISISRGLLHYPFISSYLPNYTNFATVSAKILPHLIHVFDERGRFYDSNGKHRDWWNSETARYFRVIVECFDGLMQNVLGVSVSIGWNAYNSTKEPYAVFPGLDQLTDNALFFYSLVKVMCGSDPSKINKALASVPQFNHAFNCRNNSRMNPATKCKLAS